LPDNAGPVRRHQPDERNFRGWIRFQQDNASPHKSASAELGQVMFLLEWPAKSPALSPIEQILTIIKHSLKGRQFQTEDKLFEAMKHE
jgi:transposase